MKNKLNNLDTEISKIHSQEEKRQLETINLIASENYVSSSIRQAMATVFTNKYSEGYPKARYYPGNKYIDELEILCQNRALNLFEVSKVKWGVNVQPYSGSPANFAVYSALLEKNDIALGMSLSSGGHLTHGHKVSNSGKFFHFEQYGVDKNGYIDYKEVEKLAQKHKPKLIVIGASAYSRIIDFKKFSKIAKKYNSLLMADIAHIAGLVASGVHPSPFPYCDIVTTTTHKTLRGPRGAMIFSRKKSLNKPETNLIPKINKAIFPGLQGGPHNHQTAAIAVALNEATHSNFKKYTKQIIKNAQILSEELIKRDYKIISGGTDTHLMLIDLTNKNISGGEAEKKLETAGITANRNSIPNDTRSPFDPSGIRIGTTAVTTRKMKENEMKLIAKFIDETLNNKDVSHEIKKLALKFPIPN